MASKVSPARDGSEAIPITPPPTVALVRELIACYRSQPHGVSGGELHCVIDDQNIDAHFLKVCRANASAAGESLGAAICLLLLSMSRRARWRAVV